MTVRHMDSYHIWGLCQRINSWLQEQTGPTWGCSFAPCGAPGFGSKGKNLEFVDLFSLLHKKPTPVVKIGDLVPDPQLVCKGKIDKNKQLAT